MPKRSDPLERLRAICLSFPEVTERPSHGSPAFYVRGKTTLVHAWVDGHHDHTFPPAAWSHSLLGGIPASRPLVAPASSSASSLVADLGTTATRTARRGEDAYRTVAPARLVHRLDAESG